jgi:hypothetical protein
MYPILTASAEQQMLWSGGGNRAGGQSHRRFARTLAKFGRTAMAQQPQQRDLPLLKVPREAILVSQIPEYPGRVRS